jgi:hypothetical protein
MALLEEARTAHRVAQAATARRVREFRLSLALPSHPGLLAAQWRVRGPGRVGTRISRK